MRTREAIATITDTSPASATTAVGSTIAGNGMLTRADLLIVDATIGPTTGGTLDVYLQRKITTNVWRDWAHFPQVTAGQTKRFTFVVNAMNQTSILDVGEGTDVSPGVSLAANNYVNSPPMGDLRAVYVSGAGTTLGASVKITFIPVTELS